MLIQKVIGSAIGRIVRLGSFDFLYQEKFVAITKMYTTQDYVVEYLPLGFKIDGEDWVLSENPSVLGWGNKGYRDRSVGMALNSINTDKKSRLDHKAFLDLYADVYRTALLEESANIPAFCKDQKDLLFEGK